MSCTIFQVFVLMIRFTASIETSSMDDLLDMLPMDDEDEVVQDMNSDLLQHRFDLLPGAKVQDAAEQANETAYLHQRKAELLSEISLVQEFNELKRREQEVASAIREIDEQLTEGAKDEAANVQVSLMQHRLELSRARLRANAREAQRQAKLYHRKAEVLTELSLVDELEALKNREMHVQAAIDSIEGQKQYESAGQIQRESLNTGADQVNQEEPTLAQDEEAFLSEHEDIDQVRVSLLQKDFRSIRAAMSSDDLQQAAEETQHKADLHSRKADIFEELLLVDELEDLRKKEVEVERAIDELEAHSVMREEENYPNDPEFEEADQESVAINENGEAVEEELT